MNQFNRRNILSVAASLLLILCFFALPDNVFANENKQPLEKTESVKKCYAMDVIFLIDQSNSMSGTDANDKYNNRIQAYQIAIEWLAQNQYSLCQNATHRIGVISFGDNVEVDLELKAIPGDQDTWEVIRESMTEAVESKQMGNTDHALAFRAAKEMLDRNPDPDSDVPRKTAIVMVTDGQPCIPGTACSAGEAMDHYLDRLETQIDTDFPFSDALFAREDAVRKQASIYGDFNQIPEEVMSIALAENEIDDQTDFFNSTYIYILALNNSTPYLSEVGETFSNIATSHGGDFVSLSNNTSEIPLQFNEVLSRLAMVKIAKGSCGTLYIQPYLSAITLNVYKSVEGVPITLYYGDPKTSTNVIEQGKGNTEAFGSFVTYGTFGPTNEMYKVISPKGGEWYIDAAVCEELHVVYQTFYPQNFQILEPSHALPVYSGSQVTDYNPDNPYYLKYQIQDTTTMFPHIAYFSNDDDFPVEISVEISKDNQIIKTTTLNYVAGATETDGYWISNDPLPVDELGEYKVAIVSAKAPCIDPDECEVGSDYEVFGENPRLGEGSYQVNNVNTFSFVISDPSMDSKVPVHQSVLDKFSEKQIPLTINLLDEKKQPISYVDLFGSKDAAEKAFSALLTINGNEIKNLTLNVDPINEYQLKTLISVNDTSLVGQGKIEVTLNGEYNYEKYLVEEKIVSVIFTRKDTIFSNPWFWYVLFGIVAAILIGLIAWFIYHRSRALTGYLEFSSTQTVTNPISMPVSQKWDSKKIKLPMVVGGFPAVVKNLDGKSAEIEITYTSRGKKEHILLKSNQSKQMPSGIPYTIRYVGAKREDSNPGQRVQRYNPYKK